MTQSAGTVSSVAAAGGVEAPERLRPGRGAPDRARSILWTKLVAAEAPAGFVPRPRLNELLGRGVEAGPLTLVSASPGTGKSALLSSWAAEQGDVLEMAWVSLDREDNWAPRFWARRRRALTGRAREADRRPGSPDRRPRDAARHARRARPRRRPGAREPQRAERGQTLIARAPPDLHVVLAARADPGLRLQRLRLAGDLAEIRAADLAFTRARVRERCWPRPAVHLDDEAIETLARARRAGRPACAWRPCRCGAQPDPARLVRRFAGDDAAVMRLPAERDPRAASRPTWSTFLLRTSVPDMRDGRSSPTS